MSRVLQLVTRDEPGGVRVLARMVEAGLRARGHEVTTLALRGEGASIRGLTRQIWRGGYDAILSYQVAASLIGHAVAWAAGVPLRATHLTALPLAMRPHWRWLDRGWGVLGLHTHIVANSVATEGATSAYPASYRRRLRLIPHGVEPLPAATPRDWRKQRAIPDLAPLLVSSGRLVAQKNHALAVAALVDLPAAHLLIAGDGPLRELLLRQADTLGVAHRLHLLGELDAERLAGLLDIADLYLFPSTWESFGLAVVEAAIQGVPIVASDMPVLREVLKPALARFHAADSAAAMAQEIASCLADYPAIEARKASAQATMQAHAVEAMIDRYCRLLDGSI